MSDTVSPSSTEIHIRPRKGWQAIPFKELWEFRDLLWIFSLRDIKVRYKQATLGIAWAFLQPAVQVFVFTIFFGKFMGQADRVAQLADGREIPYPLFMLAALLLWNFFSATVSSASMSLIANAGIVRKIYFPRLIMPLSSAGATLMDATITFGLLIILMAWYAMGATYFLLLIPLLCLSILLAALGIGLFLSALSVTYRDFKYVVPFLMSIWMYISPVFWAYEQAYEYFDKNNLASYKWLLNINPVSGTINLFRRIILAQPITDQALISWAISATVSIICFIFGLMYFLRIERKFADIA